MKNLVLSILALCSIGAVYSQNYYIPGTQVSAEGITYNVTKVGDYTMVLTNAGNTMGDVKQLYYKDGKPLEAENYNSVSARPAPGMFAKALTSTFTKPEFEELRQIEKPLIVAFYISPDGNILDLVFTWSAISDMQRIPPSKFALLEQNLKKYVTFEVNPLGRRLQFMSGFRFINFSKIQLYYPGDPQPGIKDPQIDMKPQPDGRPGLADPTDDKTLGN